MVLEATTELEVWLLNQWAGTLRQRGGELQFQYSERWLAQPQAIALSQSLPLQAGAFCPPGLPALFCWIVARRVTQTADRPAVPDLSIQ